MDRWPASLPSRRQIKAIRRRGSRGYRHYWLAFVVLVLLLLQHQFLFLTNRGGVSTNITAADLSIATRASRGINEDGASIKEKMFDDQILATNRNTAEAYRPQPKPTLVITGLVKDAQEHLASLKATIHRVAQDFDLKGLVFYENDSTDDTVSILNSWKDKSWSTGAVVEIKLISERNVRILDRTNRLAYGRNILLSQLITPWRGFRMETVDYVLMMDMDEVNYHLSGVSTCLNGDLPTNFGACCTNQHTIYYDLWALRTPWQKWVNHDIWRFPMSTRIISRLYRHIPASAAPIPVTSCFGGAALYNATYLTQALSAQPLILDGTSTLSKALYNGTQYDSKYQKKFPVCEHVPFHNALMQHSSNFTLFIQPKMLNDGPPHDFDKAINMASARLEQEWIESNNDLKLATYYKNTKE